jgi:hypothetical protein
MSLGADKICQDELDWREHSAATRQCAAFSEAGCYLRRRRAAAASPAAHAPAANTASVAGSGTGDLPGSPGSGGGHQDGTNLQVAPAYAGALPKAITAAVATSAQNMFLMFCTTVCLRLSQSAIIYPVQARAGPNLISNWFIWFLYDCRRAGQAQPCKDTRVDPSAAIPGSLRLAGAAYVAKSICSAQSLPQRSR